MENKGNMNGNANGNSQAPFWQNIQAEDVQVNLNNLLKVLKSRWYWMLGTLLISMVICLLFLKITQPEYQSEATLKYNSNRSEEHTSELQSLMSISYAVFCLKT